jgi:hypothetical protein
VPNHSCCVSRTETCTLLPHYAIFLVIRAPSIALNSTLDQRIGDQALEEDPASAKGEWLAEPGRCGSTSDVG